MRYNSTLSLPSAVDGVGNQSHAPAALPLERTATQCIGGLVGSTGPFWEGKENLPPPTEIRTPDRPAHSKSLYQLSSCCRSYGHGGCSTANVLLRYIFSITKEVWNSNFGFYQRSSCSNKIRYAQKIFFHKFKYLLQSSGKA